MKLAASSLLLLSQQIVGDEIWSLSHRSLEEYDVRRIVNPRLRNLESKFLVNADLGKLFTNSESSEHSFELPDANGNIFRASCQLTSGITAAHPDLLEKYPSLNTLSGRCVSEGLSTEDEQAVYANVIYDAESVDSFSATFTLEGASRPIYVDHTGEVGAPSYVLYRGDDLAESTSADIGQPAVDFLHIPKGVNVTQGFGPYGTGDKHKNRDLQSSFTVKKYCFALLSTKGFSNYHGGTRESALAALMTVVQRMNNLYLRELGVYFELIPDADLAICLSNETDSTRATLCDSLPEDSGELLYYVPDHLATLGVPTTAYDLGHAIHIGGGGVAYVGLLCEGDGWNARAASGINVPYTDGYTIDIILHEVGHQFDMGHSFRDCFNSSSGTYPRDATESGSGVSMMAYPGLCGSRTVARSRQFFFTGNVLTGARAKIGSTTCGQISTVPDVGGFSIRSATEGTCEIPIGNYVGIDVTGKDSSKFYSWERNDAGYQDFDNVTLGRANAWRPMRMAAKYFPNMHYLTYPETSTNYTELLPSEPATWRWVLTERSQYVLSGPASQMNNVDLGLVGQIHQIYTTTEFVDSTPAALSLSSTTITPGIATSVSFTIDSNLVSTASIFVARNVLTATLGSTNSTAIDGEFDWIRVVDIALSSGQNSYTGNVVFPGLSSNSDTTVAVMLRASTSADADLCYFFDVTPGVTLRSGTATVQASDNWQSLESVTESDDGNELFFEIWLVAAGLVLILSAAVIFRRRTGNKSTGRKEQAADRALEQKDIKL